jgi:hypothetical protein
MARKPHKGKNLRAVYGPLRKVLGHRPARKPDGTRYFNIHDEVLECGHAAHIKSDFMGETNAYRRRCRKCRDGKPNDVAFEPDGSWKDIEPPAEPRGSRP